MLDPALLLDGTGSVEAVHGLRKTVRHMGDESSLRPAEHKLGHLATSHAEWLPHV